MKRSIDKIELFDSFANTYDGVRYFCHKIGFFGSKYIDEETLLITEIIKKICKSSEEAVLCFYPYFETEEWEKIASSGWKGSAEKKFKRKGFFNRNKEFLWVIGHCDTWEKFREVFHFSWNLCCFNETFLVVHNVPGNLRPLVDNFVDDMGPGMADEKLPDNELALDNEVKMMKYYPTIFSRFYDKDHLRVYSTEIDEEEMKRVLVETKKVIVS